MSDSTTIPALYIDAWNEADSNKRAALIARAWADDAHYIDPLMQGAGQDAINTMIGGAQTQFPGCRFSLLGTPDAHNDRLRFRWSLHAPDGAVVARGTDFATTAPDGRLRQVTGFLDQ